jgi:hypothetical protein
MALSQCLDCASLTMNIDVSGKFLYRCKQNKSINKLDACPYFIMKV